ncbi:hypothetical protein EVAR_41653_1 [Eumeta japonica]|uniref:Uncharacterized protein n=1 Tax=Eumeta variegata TaxID=151549 RepID=A0A4C1X3H5_EUMVA|nr:hypothetical protein EVAR_41653_1 [Eumeta japonica]
MHGVLSVTASLNLTAGRRRLRPRYAPARTRPRRPRMAPTVACVPRKVSAIRVRSHWTCLTRYLRQAGRNQATRDGPSAAVKRPKGALHTPIETRYTKNMKKNFSVRNRPRLNSRNDAPPPRTCSARPARPQGRPPADDDVKSGARCRDFGRRRRRREKGKNIEPCRHVTNETLWNVNAVILDLVIYYMTTTVRPRNSAVGKETGQNQTKSEDEGAAPPGAARGAQCAGCQVAPSGTNELMLLARFSAFGSLGKTRR